MTPVVLFAVFITTAACGSTDPALLITIDLRLAADPMTAMLGLDVSVTRGIVRLEGEVNSPAQRRRVIELARTVPGVKNVIDAMYPGDEAIATTVRHALASDPLVGRIPITVTARHGTVQLISDQTGKEDRMRAVEIAAHVEGVKKVEDLMR
jgi:osmotically-inducible protein OsmY